MILADQPFMQANAGKSGQNERFLAGVRTGVKTDPLPTPLWNSCQDF
jgi:hypothetical protein